MECTPARVHRAFAPKKDIVVSKVNRRKDREAVGCIIDSGQEAKTEILV